ncbi:4'-phosphopantetheinyl transferase family protein [Geomonas sp.]|uniref:4'-phosphopantetheinyl transferase family protein n=1 Tax=Geomonas sp. TaxID=2651584 RepID=UPI002B45F23D|nr:4'-phosphopantetheinyl transferase superfamily protein [Geomonas sp.]
MSEAELRRGNRLLDPKRRDDFFVGRGILRELLGDILGKQPAAIELTEGEFGKPQLGHHQGGIDFNVSHAGSLLLAAFTQGRRVGVDLELLQPDLAFRPMAERYFSTREREELFSLPQEEQLAAFYRCWTRKEAYLKGTGSGFSRPSTEFDVSLLPGEPAALLEHRGIPGEIGRWRFEETEVPEGYCASLAVELK